MKKGLLCLCLLLIFANSRAQDGTLDLSFGKGGVIPWNSASTGYGVFTSQPGGKLVSVNVQNGNIVLSRYTPDFILDESFGTGGSVAVFAGITVLSTMEVYAYLIKVQDDGTILIGGRRRNSISEGSTLLLRFTPNGTLDAGFGTGGIQVAETFPWFSTLQNGGAGWVASLSYMIVQKDGKIVIGDKLNSYTGESFKIYRLNADGSPDNSFIPYVPSSDQNNSIRAVAVQDDGKVLVSYITTAGTIVRSRLIRLGNNGKLDPDFLNNENTSNYSISGLVIQKSGKIVALIDQSRFVRYYTNGTLDYSFGVNGITVMPTEILLSIYATGFDFLIQEDDKVIACGFYAGDGFLVRYLPDGMPDSSFGRGYGLTVSNFGEYEGIAKMVRSGNRLYAYVASNTDTKLAAYHLSASALPLTIYYQDADGDGYGNPAANTAAAALPHGYVTDKTDCNDENATMHPGAAESLNGLDDNCNGQADEGLSEGNLHTYYKDLDGDGWGRDDDTKQATTPPEGYVALHGDCADWDASIHPGATETFNWKDDDCDGLIDEGPGDGPFTTYYKDVDGDGWGRDDDTKQATVAPPGYAALHGDCADWDAGIHPGAPEVFNWKDDDCDGLIDEGTIPTATFSIGSGGVDIDGVLLPGVKGSMAVAAFPNPSSSYFSMLVKSSDAKPVQYRVTDLLGRVVEIKRNVPPNSTIRLGATYRPGTYLLEVMQGGKKETVKLIKVAN